VPWFKVDDNLAFHAKAVAAGNPALGLWVRAGSWAAQQLTDGFVPTHMLAALGTKQQAERLVAVGLWDRTEGGYAFHEWDERQPSRADVEAERAAAKERMRKAREAKKQATQGASSQVSEPRSGDVRPNSRRSAPEVRVTPTRPDPTRPDPIEDGEPASAGSQVAAIASPAATLALFTTEPTAQSLVGEWIDHCDQRPPGRVVGQVAKELKTLLDEGIEPERVRAALAEWNRKGLHPSTLASVVHEIGNRAPAAKGQQATNDLFDRAMARAIAKESA